MLGRGAIRREPFSNPAGCSDEPPVAASRCVRGGQGVFIAADLETKKVVLVNGCVYSDGLQKAVWVLACPSARLRVCAFLFLTRRKAHTATSSV